MKLKKIFFILVFIIYSKNGNNLKWIENINNLTTNFNSLIYSYELFKNNNLELNQIRFEIKKICKSFEDLNNKIEKVSNKIIIKIYNIFLESFNNYYLPFVIKILKNKSFECKFIENYYFLEYIENNIIKKRYKLLIILSIIFIIINLLILFLIYKERKKTKEIKKNN